MRERKVSEEREATKRSPGEKLFLQGFFFGDFKWLQNL